jgi:cytosine/uracil/thiamine/allantoin permease
VLVKSGGHLSMNFGGPKLSTPASIKEFFVVISLVVSYFAAMLLNFCDFSRFTPTKREVQRGNLLGLPVNFIAFAIVATVVTAGSFKVYGQYITDPVELVSKISLIPVLILGAVTFAVATLGEEYSFLGTLGAFLGPLFGILMTDYYLFASSGSPSPSCTGCTTATATPAGSTGGPWSPSWWRRRSPRRSRCSGRSPRSPRSPGRSESSSGPCSTTS